MTIMNQIKRKHGLILALILIAISCDNKQPTESSFEVLNADKTGLDFSNKLKPTNDFNLFDYMYYYNGSGVGAGDFNNDGLIDVFFAANQGDDKLYLNEGGLKFKDVTEASQIPQDGAWSTGVSVVDINNDGLLDIYVSRVGNYKSLRGKNQFLICQKIGDDGVPVYKDMAATLGLGYIGFSTQAAFLDIDMDGDLDMFLLNHSVHENGVYRPRREFLGAVHSVAGARLFRNDGLKFSDITAESGVNSSVIGYGLGIAVADINLDGYPDLYIGNDFHENDYLYINNGKGKFTEEITSRVGHTSRFSMGVDIADITNDGHSEIISMDMLSDDPYTLKRSLGEDDYDIFNLKISYGYQHQYTRNNLQLNRGNGTFSEVGLYAGVAATDWSWSPLLIDFDNDGFKDLFISNGIPKRMNDIDYINFVSNEEMQKQLSPGGKGGDNLQMIEKFPKIKVPNKFFRNNGKLQFEDMGATISNAVSTYSNGAIYADFDNDGDLDIIVNNIDESATLYRNTLNQRADSTMRRSLKIKLTGDSANRNAVGAKVLVYMGDKKQIVENFSVHGFQSSVIAPLHIGLGQGWPDSMLVVWPDNTYEKCNPEIGKSDIHAMYKKGLPVFEYKQLFSSPEVSILDVTSNSGLLHRHEENIFAEYNREALLPHMLSTEGPALAVADINGDGLEDVFIGSSRGKKAALWIQTNSGQFRNSVQPALEADSIYEDVSAVWADVDGDGLNDLLVASGGNEFFGQSPNLLPRLYINEAGKLRRKKDAFPAMYITSSIITTADINGDGFVDVFVGGRAVPMDYGVLPSSFLLLNDGKGNFRDVTATVAPDLQHTGFVTGASWADIDRDGDLDLLISREWGELLLFNNDGGKFSQKILTDRKGWWNFMLPVDIDNDGDLDIVAGNLGLNSRLKASIDHPVTMYHHDFDDNGRNEQLLTYFVRNKEVPFASLAELTKQMPFIKKKFLYAGDFASAGLQDIFEPKTLRAAAKYTADYFSSAVLINQGNGVFDLHSLPWEAQLTPYRDAVVLDVNNDSLPDILMAGNYFDSNTEMGRYDSDASIILLNKGNGNFKVERVAFPWINQVQARHVAVAKSKDKNQYVIFAINNDSIRVARVNHEGKN